MKNLKYFIVGILFVLVQHTNGSNPDEWSGRKTHILLSNWSVNINLGTTSYFGDLSEYDVRAIRKLFYESKVAVGLKLTKNIRYFGISGQVIYGGLKSDYLPEHTFETRMLEYSIQTGVNLIPIIFKQRLRKYGFEVYVGMGQFIFNTYVNSYTDGQQTTDSFSTGVPEFVYFFGGELRINIAEKLWFTTNLSIRQIQNDNMDKYISSGDFDYYSLFNIGVTYYFGKLYSGVSQNPQQRIRRGRPRWR